MHFRYALVLLSLLSSIPVLAASVKIDPRDILPNTVDSTEFGSLNGARSNLQTQIDNILAASVKIDPRDILPNTVDSTEFGSLNGARSNLQTQIDNIGFSSTQTLQTVTARGSNTTANVVLAGYWTRIGISDGTETWTGVTAGLNLGYNTGARTNIGTGAINSGVVVSPGLQYASGSGSENHGRVYNSGSQIVTGSGSENHGVVTQSGVQTNGGRGSLNFGSVHGGIQYITGDGSANFGDTGAGEYQTNTATAAFNFGSKNVNSHDYSAVFGYGVNSFDTNSAVARVFYATQAFMPTASNAVDLGSAAFPFRDLYIGSNSLWMAGVRMLTISNGQAVVGLPVADSTGTAYLKADGSVVWTGNQNAGGKSVTNFSGLAGAGPVALTSANMSLGSADATQAKLYVTGEAGYYTNKPLVVLNRTPTATGNIFQWSTNNVSFGYIGADGRIYTTIDPASQAPAANEYATAGWVRGLAVQGAAWYYTATLTNVWFQPTNGTVLLSAAQPASPFTNNIPSPVPASTYLAAGMSTNTYTAVKSPVTFSMYLARVGGNSSSVIPVHPEMYYVYEGTTNLLGDWEVPSQNVNSTTPTLFMWTIAFSEPAVTGAVRYVGRLKSGTPTGSAAGLAIYGGGTFSSYMSIPSASGTGDHNSLSGLQGGTSSEYYHLTQADHVVLTNNVQGFTLLVQDPTNGIAYWMANPFGTRSCTITEAFVKSHGMTGTVDLVSQHRTQAWYTYASVTNGVAANSTGTAQTSFAGPAAVTNGMMVGFVPQNLSAFAATNMLRVDFTIRCP